MIEKPKRPKKIPNQDNKQPQTIQELTRRYDLDNKDIYDYLDSLILQINKQYKQTVENMYPIGSIYMSVNSVNPKELFGGEWVAWGSGRVPVGIDTTQTEFATAEKTGGEKTHKLTIEETPKHRHSIDDPYYRFSEGTYGLPGQVYKGERVQDNTSYTDNVGGDKPHNNLQPYITCYMWKRIS